MVRSAVQVCIRTRPTANFAHQELVIKPEERTVDVNISKNPKMGIVNNARENFHYQFDKIMHNSSQDTVYAECVSSVVSSVAQGYNGTVLVYGQTGAGKTYTMSGGTGNYKTRGCIPRAIQEIFAEVSARPDQVYTIKLSYLEIYNETLYDLLHPAGVVTDDSNKLQIIEDSKGNITVKGLTLAMAGSEEEAMNLFFEGETNRAIAEHQLNSSSSRSHCILTVYVESRSRVESADRVLSSKIHMVDLAGSERVTKTHSTGAILREAMYINKSLSFLEQCVGALSTPGRDHVPFRQSRLTHVLSDSLGGNCKTVMIANIWGEAAQLDETISTLAFATRMMKVKSEVSVNVKVDAHLLVKKYEQEIKELKQELAMHDALSGRNRATYDPYTEEQRFELQQQIKAYCKGDIDNIEVVNLRHITEVLQQFKILTNNALEEAKSGRPAGGGEGEDEPQGAEGEAAHADGGVGELVGGGGGSIGRAPDGAKPLVSVKTGEIGSPARDGSVSGSPKKAVKMAAGAVAPDKNQAFEEYKQTDGQTQNGVLRENTASLKEKRLAQKELAATINTAKKQIDAYKVQLEERREQVGAGETDEEEFAIVRMLKGAKAEYRKAYDDLKMLKSETDWLNKQVEVARQKLVGDFEEWYRASYEDNEGAADASMHGRADGDGEELDDGEKFDRLEVERVMMEAPDSLAYHNAAKNVFRKTTVGAHGKSKRVKGEANPQPVV